MIQDILPSGAAPHTADSHRGWHIHIWIALQKKLTHWQIWHVFVRASLLFVEKRRRDAEIKVETYTESEKETRSKNIRSTRRNRLMKWPTFRFPFFFLINCQFFFRETNFLTTGFSFKMEICKGKNENRTISPSWVNIFASGLFFWLRIGLYFCLRAFTTLFHVQNSGAHENVPMPMC